MINTYHQPNVPLLHYFGAQLSRFTRPTSLHPNLAPQYLPSSYSCSLPALERQPVQTAPQPQGVFHNTSSTYRQVWHLGPAHAIHTLVAPDHQLLIPAMHVAHLSAGVCMLGKALPCAPWALPELQGSTHMFGLHISA